MQKFHGVGPAIVTPFKKNGAVDWQGLDKLIQFLLKNGVDYLVVQGTTGESPTVSPEEKLEILERVVSLNKKRVPIVYGIGGNSTKSVIEVIKTSNLKSVDAILSVSPYYNKPSQRGIESHFLQIADASPVPIILYNVPSRTGSNIEAKTTARLSTHKNIIGIKEASGNLEQAMEIIKGSRKGFLLISGEDLLTIPLISIGAVGVISVLANAFPKEFCKSIHHALKGDFKRAQGINQKFLGLNPLMYKEGNPVGIKAAMNLLGIIGSNVRSPLINASPELIKAIKEEIKKAAY